MNSTSLAAALVTGAVLTACAPAAPPVDAGIDALAVDAGPCGAPCADGERCCPEGLSSACLPLTAAGECPLPDLTVDAMRAEESARTVWRYFPPTDCALIEGCVDAPGWRRLLRFETFTPNIGTGDMNLGVPNTRSPNFVFSECHGHYHFEGYADYRLNRADGTEVARGHKQAFCLMDTLQIDPAPDVRTSVHYTCFNQGISRGWGDDYYAGLDCQWIDVTDVPAGEYVVHITINGEHTLAEVSYDNNVADAPVTLTDPSAPVDPLAPCAATLDGPRDCGWSVAQSFDCTAGSMIDVGCGSACDLGACTADVMMRVCPGDVPCASHEELGFADEGCAPFGGRCPLVTVPCPSSGRVTVMTAPYVEGDAAASCVPAMR